jgi:hypothetical protein
VPLIVHRIVGRRLRARTGRLYASRSDAFARDHSDDHRKHAGYYQQPAIEPLATQMLLIFV